MNERDLIIWMAGFFDGEGCVSVGRSLNRKPDGQRRAVWTYSLQLAIEQKCEAPLLRFRDLFGGSYYLATKKGVTYYRWSISSHKAAIVLEKLLPYLVVKRAVAECGLRFQVQMTAWNREYGRRGYPSHVIEGREIFYHEARALNAKQRTNNRAPKYAGPRAVLPMASGQ